MIPIAARNPSAGTELVCLFANSSREFLRRAGIAQINREPLKAAIDEVRVIVNETGQRQLAFQIDHAGLGRNQLLHVGARAHCDYALAARCRGFGSRLSGIGGPDASAQERKVGFR